MRIRKVIGWMVFGSLVGGAIAQSLHATPTRARKLSAKQVEVITDTQGGKWFRVNGAGSLDDLVSWAGKNGLSNLTQAEIKGTFNLFDGNITFAQKALLSSKEIVSGKTLPELVQHFNLPTIPSAQSLTPYQARIWYSWQKSQISILVNRSNGLEAAAREAVEMRNTIRTTTRTSMKDVDMADFLNIKGKNMTWDEAFIKYGGDYEKIIEGSMRGRGAIDELFKIPK